MRRDAAGRLTFVNRAFSRVFGVEGAEMLGKPFRPIVHEGESPESATFEHELRRTYTQRIETAHGARWYAWEEQLIPAAQGHAQQYQCVGRDTTIERQAQAESGRGPRCRAGGEPRQIPLPGRHEPRDPHAHERHSGHDQPAGRNRADARAGDLHAGRRPIRQDAARHHRRDPGLLEDRGRQARSASGAVRAGRGRAGRRRTAGAARARKRLGDRLDDRAVAATRGGRRRYAVAPDPDESDRQCHQIHRSRRHHDCCRRRHGDACRASTVCRSRSR